MEVFAENTLFIGPLQGNTGPANVNKSLVNCWPRQIIALDGRTKFKKIVNLIRLLGKTDVVFSMEYSWSGWIAFRLCRLVKKPYVALIHGYVPYENAINHLGIKQSACTRYEKWLSGSTKIVVFSNVQKKLMTSFLPQIKEKIVPCPMTIKSRKICSIDRDNLKPVVAVSGGTRPIKNNEKAYEAVKRFCSLYNSSCEFRIYGRDYCGDKHCFDDGSKVCSIRFMGQVPNEQFEEDLKHVDLLIMASMHEPFGISAIDALQSGASLLVSEHCGVAEAINVSKQDVIYDSDSLEIVASKIKQVLRCPNAQRLMEGFDYKKYSDLNAAEEVWRVCNKAVMEQRDA